MAKKSYGRGGKDDDEDTEEAEAAEAVKGAKGAESDEPPKSVSTKGSLTEKSVTVGVESIEGIQPGMIISGEGIEYGTAVVRADGTGVVMDKAANETKADVALTFSMPAF